MEGQKIQWPSERRVNGRTDNTMAIRKKGKWKDRQLKPLKRRVNGKTDNTMAIRKKSKWKDRQYNGHQKKG